MSILYRAAGAEDLQLAGELAREIWLPSEGAISLMLVHGDRGYAAAAAGAAKRLMQPGNASAGRVSPATSRRQARHRQQS
jgi:hypothetical protein